MYEGQPFSIAQALPAGVSVDNFYVAASGLGAFIAVLAIGMTLFKFDRSARRVKMLQERRVALSKATHTPKRRQSTQESSVHWMRKVVSKFKLLKNTQITQVENQMVEAGWRTKDALVVFAFFTLVLPIVFGIAGVVMMQMHVIGGSKAKDIINYALPVFMLYVGLKFPAWVVARRRKKRYTRIQRALADTLDLMTICAEAGLSLSSSIDRVSRELMLTYPEMAEELSITSMELGFLPERNQALVNLSKRVTLQEVRGIVSVLIQTEKYGTPIAQALRVLSAEFREQRMLRAENKAARLPAMMTVPMIVFILPTLFIVIIAPSAIRIMSM